MTKREKRSRSVAAVAALVALALLQAGAATASDASDYRAARSELTDLEAKLTAGEAGVQDMQTRMHSLGTDVQQQQADLDAAKGDVDRTNREYSALEADANDLHHRLLVELRTAYANDPLTFAGRIAVDQTLGRSVGRLSFLMQLAQQDGPLAGELHQKQAQLSDVRDRQAHLAWIQKVKLDTLRAEQSQLVDLFVRQQQAIADLNRSRARALELLDRLAARLPPDMLAALRVVAGHGMPITYDEWAHELLAALGAPATNENLVAVVAWETAEGTQATWNPLATTHNMPGATAFNDVGVRNYTSKQQGIDATLLTLSGVGHAYEAIVASLRAAARAEKTAEAINASDWCHGCSGGDYVVGLVAAVRAYYDAGSPGP